MSDAVIIALIGAVAATANVIVTSIVLLKTRQTHDLVNGMSHELSVAKTGQDRAEGFALGEAAERDRER